MKLSRIAILLLGMHTAGLAYAASPFVAVPLYLSRIEQSNVKSNIMLVIDDSGSMRDVVLGTGGKNRMTVAKEVAVELLREKDAKDGTYKNLSQFRFGLAHLFMDIDYGGGAFLSNLYAPANPDPTNYQNCDTNPKCASKIILAHIDDAEEESDHHVQELIKSINSLTDYYATPTYSTLSEVYKAMPNYMQYRCQKNYVIMITDGEPQEQNKSTPTEGPTRYTSGVAYLRPLITTEEAANTDYKTTGNDAEGESWNQKPWEDQTIRTSIIAFAEDVSAASTLSKEGKGFYLTASGQKELSQAISNILSNITRSPNPVPVSPTYSQVIGPELNVLSIRLYTDVSNWSSQLRILRFSSGTGTEEKDGDKLVYKSPKYPKEGTHRSTVINTKDNGVQTIDRPRIHGTTVKLGNADFGIDSTDKDEWKNKFIPWLDSWAEVKDSTSGYRERAQSLTNEERFLGDVFSGSVLGVGALRTLGSGTDTVKINKYILLNSNDGMLKIYRATNDLNAPYELKFNYIAGAAKRENDRMISEELKNRAKANYGSSTDPTYPHEYFGNGEISQLTSPRGQSIVVSTLGQGGRAAFALNLSGNMETTVSKKVGLEVGTEKINAGTSMTPAAEDGIALWKDSVPLWDTSANVKESSTASVISDMGYTISRPAIDLVALKRNKTDGKPIITGGDADVRMVAFVGNGYKGFENASDHTPTLHMIDAIGASMTQTEASDSAQLGQILKSIAITATTTGANNIQVESALSSPSAIDLDGDGIADLVYVGDRNGNVYRIDLRSDTPAGWTVRTIFEGESTRPITIAPKIYRKTRYGTKIVILFGTGSDVYEQDGNLSDTASAEEKNIQEMYAVFDDVTKDVDTAKRDELLEQKIVKTLSYNDVLYRETTSEKMTSQKGWRIALTPRERIVKDIEVYNGTIFFNTMIIKPITPPPPGAICYVSEAQGTGWSMGLDAETGATPSNTSYIHSIINDDDDTQIVSGRFHDKVLSGVSMMYKDKINPHTNEPYAHDYYGLRTTTGKSIFGATSLETGKIIQKEEPPKCVGRGIVLPGSGSDPENIALEEHSMDGECNEDSNPIGFGVRRISWVVLS